MTIDNKLNQSNSPTIMLCEQFLIDTQEGLDVKFQQADLQANFYILVSLFQVSSGSGKSWCVPGSVSSYSVGARSVPASASLYSVTSGESSLSGELDCEAE